MGNLARFVKKRDLSRKIYLLRDITNHAITQQIQSILGISWDKVFSLFPFLLKSNLPHLRHHVI
jgi:hypothetical protein